MIQSPFPVGEKVGQKHNKNKKKRRRSHTGDRRFMSDLYYASQTRLITHASKAWWRRRDRDRPSGAFTSVLIFHAVVDASFPQQDEKSTEWRKITESRRATDSKHTRTELLDRDRLENSLLPRARVLPNMEWQWEHIGHGRERQTKHGQCQQTDSRSVHSHFLSRPLAGVAYCVVKCMTFEFSTSSPRGILLSSVICCYLFLASCFLLTVSCSLFTSFAATNLQGKMYPPQSYSEAEFRQGRENPSPEIHSDNISKILSAYSHEYDRKFNY